MRAAIDQGTGTSPDVTTGSGETMAQAAKAAKTTKTTKAAKTTKVAKPNVFAKLGRYLSDVRAEMRRVVWPSRKEVINSSGIVITTLIIFVLLILVYDQVAILVVNTLGKVGS
jgi:preprotein translocase subunit SecE